MPAARPPRPDRAQVEDEDEDDARPPHDQEDDEDAQKVEREAGGLGGGERRAVTKMRWAVTVVLGGSTEASPTPPNPATHLINLVKRVHTDHRKIAFLGHLLLWTIRRKQVVKRVSEKNTCKMWFM